MTSHRDDTVLMDERWGRHWNLSGNTVDFTNLKLGDTFTIDMWFRLHYYPVMKGENIKNPTLMVFGDNFRIHYDAAHIHIGITNNKYSQDEWFHLVIVCGNDSQTASGGSGKLYINSKLTDSTLDLPANFNNIIVGNVPPKGYYSSHNPAYIDNLLGAVKIYGRALDSHEVGNNFMSLAQTYGLVVDARAPYIKTGLIIDHQPFPPKPKDKEKNINDNYKSMSELQQLSKLFAQLHSELKGATPAATTSTSVKCRDVAIPEPKTEVSADLVMLSSNPEFFMKMLRQPSIKLDEATRKVHFARESCTAKELSDILSNQFKANLLVTYLKQNPKNFIDILSSNMLNLDQLSQLNNMLKQSASIEAFSEGIEEDDEEYAQALSMLNNYLEGKQHHRGHGRKHHSRASVIEVQVPTAPVPTVATPQYIMVQQPQPQHQPHMQSHQPTHSTMPLIQPHAQVPAVPQSMYDLASSTGKIAHMMEQDRVELELKKQHEKERNLFKKLHKMNKEINDGNDRIHKLEKLLTLQKDLVGVLVNKAGQCVGAVGKGGKIHKGKSDLHEPVNIIMNKSEYQLNIANILKQHQLHNLTITELAKMSRKDKHMHLLGQCINRNHHTIAAIVRYSDENHYIPTVESEPLADLPIIAMIDASSSESPKDTKHKVAAQKPTEAPKKECKDGKCAPGFKPVLPSFATASWLSGLGTGAKK